MIDDVLAAEVQLATLELVQWELKGAILNS